MSIPMNRPHDKDAQYCQGSQRQRILEHLKQGHTLTQLQALDLFGCMRLAAVIHVLREQGNCIITEERTVRDGVKIAVYRLDGEIQLDLI